MGAVADAAAVEAEGVAVVLVVVVEHAWVEAAACRVQEGACRDLRHRLAVRRRLAELARGLAAECRDRAAGLVPAALVRAESAEAELVRAALDLEEESVPGALDPVGGLAQAELARLVGRLRLA
jgi:hypothetical protein